MKIEAEHTISHINCLENHRCDALEKEAASVRDEKSALENRLKEAEAETKKKEQSGSSQVKKVRNSVGNPAK